MKRSPLKRKKTRIKSYIHTAEKVLDKVFSLWIRRRDKICQFPLRSKDDYHAGSLQNSHFYGRNARSVRWDEDNCDAICARHHQFLEERKNAEYADWKLRQLGQERFDALKAKYYQLKRWTEPEKVELLEKYK